jgi:methylmalonyl-CoA mutase N-terminal domain/subunit
MKERFGAKRKKSMQLRFHTQTAGSTLTAQQPQVNVVRVALQAMASVMGGTQSLHTNSWDEALGLPTEDAVRLALRTQQVIAHESGVADQVDPFAGSYVIEELTHQIEAGAREYIDRIDEMGGAVAGIENGFQQSEIQEAAYQAQLALERNDSIVVGVNEFETDEARPTDLLTIDEEVEGDQRERLADFKASRSSSDVETARNALENAARGSDNLMPHILHAVKQKVTLGEISDTLRGVFGQYVENVVI